MKLLDHTPWTLAELNEQDFEHTMQALEYLASEGYPRAKWLVEVADAVAEEFGTYEREFVDALDQCPYTQSHTRHWCGHLLCRDS